MSLQRTQRALLGLTAVLASAAACANCGGKGAATTASGSTGSSSSSSSSTASTGTGMPQDRALVLLFTADEHSHLFAFSPELDDHPTASAPGAGDLVGGVARRAVVLAAERDAAKKAGKATLTVSAGDNQMGALPHLAFESDSIDYATMKALGYDVTTLGNHEFDFGPKALAQSINAAKAGGGLPAIVASNIHFSAASPADDDLAALYSDKASDAAAIHPYRVITTDSGLKVGFVGILGVNAAHVAPNKTPVQFSAMGVDPAKDGDRATVLPKLYADIQPIVDQLRKAEAVDIVVALSHSGIADSSTDATAKQGEDYLIAQNVKGIDLIVSGHEHNPDPKPIVVKSAVGGPDTLVLNASFYGQHVGRVELTVHGDPTQPVTWNATTQALLPVDDKTVADTKLAGALDGYVARIEKSGIPANKPFLEGLLTRVTGNPVKDDPTKAGDLYFYPLGKTSFDLTEAHSLLFLSTDAMLAQADKEGKPADMALDSAGAIRSMLKKGKTGVISAADAFNVVPLGASPVDGTLAYPMIRANINLLEMRGILEFALALRKTNTDFDLGQAGVRYEYDATRPPAKSVADLFATSKGQVMRIWVDSDHANGFEQFDKLIYDRVNAVGDATALYRVVASSYVGQFAADAGVNLKDDQAKPLALKDAILHHADGPEVKQVGAFMAFIAAAPGGTLAPLYDAKSPMATKRIVCVAGCP